MVVSISNGLSFSLGLAKEALADVKITISKVIMYRWRDYWGYQGFNDDFFFFSNQTGTQLYFPRQDLVFFSKQLNSNLNLET